VVCAQAHLLECLGVPEDVADVAAAVLMRGHRRRTRRAS
jgi:hypothetical protein